MLYTVMVWYDWQKYQQAVYKIQIIMNKYTSAFINNQFLIIKINVITFMFFPMEIRSHAFLQARLLSGKDYHLIHNNMYTCMYFTVL